MKEGEKTMVEFLVLNTTCAIQPLLWDESLEDLLTHSEIRFTEDPVVSGGGERVTLPFQPI